MKRNQLYWTTPKLPSVKENQLTYLNKECLHFTKSAGEYKS